MKVDYTKMSVGELRRLARKCEVMDYLDEIIAERKKQQRSKKMKADYTKMSIGDLRRLARKCNVMNGLEIATANKLELMSVLDERASRK